MKTLSECIAAGIPVYKFGSPELDRLHEEALDPERLVGYRGYGWNLTGGAWQYAYTFPVYARGYGWQRHGFEYVVDHGSFYTLNRIERGQVVPHSRDLIDDRRQR